MTRALKIARALERGVGLHRSGRLSEAAGAYREVLELDRGNFDALNLLGLVEHAQGRFTEALACFERAVASGPRTAAAHFNKANTLGALGRGADAVAAYRKALALQPEYADAWLNLGASLHQQGDLAGAIAAFKEMTNKHPRDVRGHYNVGRCLAQDAQTDLAEAALSEALRLAPTSTDALITLAKLYADTQRTPEAITTIQKALALNPNNAEWLSTMAMWLTQAERHDEAIELHRRACALAPDRAELHFNLGNALYAARDLNAAASAFRAAIERAPDFAAAYNNLGETLRDTGDLDQALMAFNSALRLDPTNRAARINKAVSLTNQGSVLSAADQELEAEPFFREAYEIAPFHGDAVRNYASHLLVTKRLVEAIDLYRRLTEMQPNIMELHVAHAAALLTAGKFQEGWNEFKWFRLYYDTGKRPPEDQVPLCSVSPLAGSRVIVCAESGVGDEILTASMVPDVIDTGASVTLLCSGRLLQTFQRSFPSIKVLAHEMVGQVPTAGACQMTISELGLFFRNSRDDFGKRFSFLTADENLRDAFRKKYKKDSDHSLVGIAWHSAHPTLGAAKSYRLEQMLKALSHPALKLIDLQYGDHEVERNDAERNAGVSLIHDPEVDAMGHLDQFVNQVAAMDHVVTTSNTTVHVAGALGIPTLLLAPSNRSRNWYWHRVFEECLWYPSVRYAVQDANGGWDTALRDFIRKNFDGRAAAVS